MAVGKQYVWINNSFVPSHEPLIFVSNRAYRYGDGLFETIHANGCEPQFLELHYQRLTHGMRTLKMDIPGFF